MWRSRPAAILVGALGAGSGHVYVFTRTKSSWHQVTELKSSDLPGYAEFGEAVAISGNAALIGAPGSTAFTAGRAFVTRG